MAIGNNIKNRRIAKGWLVKELSERSGVAPSTISAIEDRDTNRSKHFADIAAALGVSVEELSIEVAEKQELGLSAEANRIARMYMSLSSINKVAAERTTEGLASLETTRSTESNTEDSAD